MADKDQNIHSAQEDEDAGEMLSFRALEPEDVDILYKVENDDDAWVSSDTVAPLSRRQLMDYAMNAGADPYAEGQLRIVVEVQNKVVGLVDLYELSAFHQRAYVGIYILPEYRRCGYGATSLQLLADYAWRHLGLSSLWARILADNHTAQDLFTITGYNFCGMLPGYHRSGAEYHDVHIYHRQLPAAE